MAEVNQHTGLLIVPPSPKAWIAGQETGMAFEERLKSGDWTGHRSRDEKQYTSSYDTMSCTTFSGLNDLEMQANWLLSTGQIPQDVVAELNRLGYLKGGKFDFNDWFSAVMSGTTENGNDFGSVWESFRKHGVLPQHLGFEPKDFRTISAWLDRRSVTTEQQAAALRFLDFFDIAYEWVLLGTNDPSVIERHLKQAPVHIGTPVCPTWNSGKVKKCDLAGISHATCAVRAKSKEMVVTLDHYDPFLKELAWDYSIPFAVKGVLSVKKPKPPAPPKPKYQFTRAIGFGSTGKDVEMLQRSLKALGYYKLDYFTEYCGWWTVDAIKAFQAAYASEILHPIGLTAPTGYFGGQSIKKLNALLA